MVFEHVIPLIQTSLRGTDQEIQQSLPFQDQPAEKSVSARVRSVKHDGKRYLQDILWQENLLAVKVSLECQTVAELTTRLREKLPQNSAVAQQILNETAALLIFHCHYAPTPRVINVNLKFG